MYDPESPTGSPATALKAVNGDSEGSSSDDSKGVDKEEDDETPPNHVAAGKTTQKLTRQRLRGIHRTADSPQRCDNEGERLTRFRGVAMDSSPTSVSEELVTGGSKGDRSGASSKNSVVAVLSRLNCSEQPEDGKAAAAPTAATVAVGQTEVEEMADDDDDAGHSIDSSLQDESSMASVTDSQASSSDGPFTKSKQKQGRPGKAAAQPAKTGRRRKSEEVPSFEGPATRRRSVRLRSGEKRRGTSPTQLSPAKRARQKKPPAAAKKQGGRGTLGKVSNGEDESTTESQEMLDEEPGTKRADSVQDQSDTSMDICSVEQHVMAPLEEESSPVDSQGGIGGCKDNPASTEQEDSKEDKERGTDRHASPAASATPALHLSSSAAPVAPEQRQEMSVETPTESKDQEEQHQKDASGTCITTCTELSTTPECGNLQNCPVSVPQPETSDVADLALVPGVLQVSDSNGRKEADLLCGQDTTKTQENSTPLVALMDVSSVSEERNAVPDQAPQSSDTKVTLQENAGESLTADSEAAAVPSHHVLSPTRSPQTMQMTGHRDRRYYCSPEKQGPFDSPDKGLSTPRSSRRKTRWQDAEANVVSEPVIVPVADPSMSPVVVPVASATLPESPLPDWVSSSKPHEALDAQDIALLPPPPPKAPSPQRKETLASLDSCRPEKVKSRWRRSSELETRDVGPVVAPPSTLARNSPPCGARMPSIREEALLGSSGKESPRKKDRSPPSTPSKECRESDRGFNRESRGGGTGSREPPESTALSRGSRDADRTETSRDRGSSGSGTNSLGSAKPLDYEEIEENLYLFERRKTKSKKEVRRMICDCSLTKDEKDRGIMGCEEDCLNRLLMIECGSRCPNGDNCSNRRFQKKTYIKVEKFMTEKKGWGLRTLETLSSGAFVMEYVGEVLTPEEFRKRVKQYARDSNQHYYFMALRSDEIIDATQKGNVSRFINHSCDPNCETQKWTVNGELRIGFFTRRPLRSGEELTFDYQFQRYGKEAQRCHCESSNCRGYIGEDTKMTLKSGRSLPPKRSSSSSSSSKRAEERKRDTVEDLAMEEEIEKLSGGLKNREHTLLLARLMVRGEDIDTRRRLLNIIRNTTETACLRLFLDYHGLSLLWSWMADIPDNELALKAEILTVLRQLPIPNKTMVKDSKVMSVVHRWASQLAEQGSSGRAVAVAGAAESDTPPPSEKQSKVASEEADSDGSESSGSQTPASAPGQRSLTGSVVCSPDSTNLVENGDSTPSDGPKDESGGKMAKELSDLASTLLDSWSSLKEVFRIPRLEQQKRREDEREADRRERERNRQQKSRESSFSSRDSGSRRRSPPSSSNRDRRDRDYERSSDRRRYSASPERRDDRKSYHRSSDHRRSGSGSDSKPRKTLLPTPPRLTKEERRQLFALEVQQRDQEEALRRQFMVPPASVQHSIVVPAPPPQGFLGPPGMVPVQAGCPTTPMGAPIISGQPAPPLQQQQQAMYVYDPATAAAMYGNPSPQPTVAYYDPQTGAPIPAPQPSAPQEYVLQHNPMLGGPQPVVAPGMQPPAAAEVGPHMVMQTPGPVVPSQQAVMVPPPDEPHPQHHALPSNIDYQALAAAISSVTNKPPSPAVVQPEAAYLTDPMQIPLPPPLSPDSGEMTPQNPDPVSSPTLDSTEEVVELLPPVQQPEVREPVGTSLEVVLPTSYEEAVATPPVLPSPTQLPPPAAAAPPPTYPSVQQTPVPVPYAVVAHGAGAPAGTPTMAAGAMYVPNPQPVASGYGPGYGPVGPTAAPGSVQAMHPQIYFLPPVAQAMHGEQPPHSAVPVQSMDDASSGCMASPPLQTQALAKKSGRLPPHWKTAKDEEGNVYYYHAQTRETQWDPPTWDENDQDMDLETPTYDEPKSKKKAVTVAADTSEVAKKIKELFRSKISSHIVHCLNPFRKPDCKLGRIQSTEDFKHLARKLTHFVMAKELKHCKNVEDLECNENVKHKAREFIQKYMAKYGPVYRKDKAVSPKDE